MTAPNATSLFVTTASNAIQQLALDRQKRAETTVPMSKGQYMYKWVQPLIRTALSKVSVETITDWGTCFATASESRDPHRIWWLLEVLMEEPIRSQGSFIDSSRSLYVVLFKADDVNGHNSATFWLDYVASLRLYRGQNDGHRSDLVLVSTHNDKLTAAEQSLDQARSLMQRFVPFLNRVRLRERRRCGPSP